MLPSGAGGSAETPGGPFGSVAGFTQNVLGELVTGLSSFTKFRDRIDEPARHQGTAAGPKRVGEVPMVRTQFGGGHNG